MPLGMANTVLLASGHDLALVDAGFRTRDHLSEQWPRATGGKLICTAMNGQGFFCRCKVIAYYLTGCPTPNCMT